jgi:hypothetical protein
MAKKIHVSRRALVQRINRALRADGKILASPRGRGGGDPYLVDVEHGRVVQANVDLAALGRKLGVVKSWEEVE